VDALRPRGPGDRHQPPRVGWRRVRPPP
jgi:hypothetical protein